MSLTNTFVKQGYAANGVIDAFAIPSQIIQDDSDEILVYTRDESTTPATVTLKTEGLHYDLTGRPDPYSFHTTVTFRAGHIPANGLEVWVIRRLALTQPLDNLNANSAIYLPDMETAYDRAIALIQQLDEALNRALKLGITSPDFDTELPEPEADAIIGYNEDGDGFENKTVSELINLSGALAIANNLSDLSNVSQALVNLGISPLSSQNKLSFVDGQVATNATGESYDGTVYTSVVYEYEVIRGTTVVSTGRFALQYKNAVWGVVDGGYEGDPHGLSWSISQVGTTAQLRIAASSSGGGDGTIKLKKHTFTV